MKLLTAFAALAFYVPVSLGLFTQLEGRAQCENTLRVAVGVGQRLNTRYFNPSNGQYTGGSLWTDANTLEDLHNLMLATGTDEFATIADTSYIGRSALNPSTSWPAILAGSNDDAGWIVLALWKIADYKRARGLNADAYLRSGATIYNLIAAEWDTVRCGGGVWWSTAHTYKNAITNELFLLTSASGYIRGGGATYLANAQKTWNWLKNSGMRNSRNLWNDGLTDGCANNGQTEWTYNQGVIASGLAALYAITGDSSLLTEAEKTLDATMSLKTTNGILRESCDLATSGGSVCNQDQQLFKGLWTKHVQFYLDMANSAARVAKYADFLWAQTSAVYHYGTSASNDIGSVWYAPNQGGSIFTPKTSASGLAAHVAAAKYAPCRTYG